MQTICKPVLFTTLLNVIVIPGSNAELFDNSTTARCLQYEMSAQSLSFSTVSPTSQALSWHAQISRQRRLVLNQPCVCLMVYPKR